MSEAGQVLVVRQQRVATVTLSNPDHTNAISRSMWEHIATTFDELSRDDRIGVVVVRGGEAWITEPSEGGRSKALREVFSSGSDLAEILESARQDQAARRDSNAQQLWKLLDAANTAIEQCPKPVIAMIDRFAYGAACALLAACDIRVADAGASIGIPAPQVGLTIGVNDTRRITSLVGSGFAKYMLISGERISAIEAYYKGFVDHLAHEQLENVVMRMARRIARWNSPLAMKEAKLNIRMAINNPSLAGVDEYSMPIVWAGSTEVVEGIEAFFERRPPRWSLPAGLDDE